MVFHLYACPELCKCQFLQMLDGPAAEEMRVNPCDLAEEKKKKKERVPEDLARADMSPRDLTLLPYFSESPHLRS